eukprot:TRINITY_DN77812_c0_g1_i1.p1 TRINITY_DN77812_c0_g1~~TRINITY_DN77812_c0_g1_i1.p1  ORF type:complete len:143 (+),score=13.87 TRINITY_DN77812_c0_g1_i1:428-856(+)
MAPFSSDICLADQGVFVLPSDDRYSSKARPAVHIYHRAVEEPQSDAELRSGSGDDKASAQDDGLTIIENPVLSPSFCEATAVEPRSENGDSPKSKKGKKLRWKDECGQELAVIREIESRETVYEFEIEIIDDDVDFCTCSMQ